MRPYFPGFRPRIHRRLTNMALVCALVPVTVLALLLVLTAKSGTIFEQELIGQVESAVNDQVRLSVEAQASRINSQLQKISLGVQLITAHTKEALSVPEAFAAEQPAATQSGDAKPAAPPAASSAAQAAADAPASSADNPLFYSKSDSGALRKVIDDGGPTVFYAARPDGRSFTQYELQRMYSTATLDPLLKQAVEADPLCAQSYILTEDNLLRTYPPVDFGNWPGDRDLTGLPMYAWAPGKADANGAVWTSPYFSQLINQWVVSCLGGVMIGGRIVAVAGVEIPLAKAREQLLGFSLGTGSSCWVARQVDDQHVQLLAAQPGAETLLSATALASAQAPSETMPGEKLLDAANYLAGDNELGQLLAGEVKQTRLQELSGAQTGKMLVLAPLEAPQWMLGGIVESQAVATVRRYQRYVDTRLMQRLAISVGAVLIGLLLAFTLGWLEARRIAHPLAVLTQQLRNSVGRHESAPFRISDEGEIGALADAVQKLVDTTRQQAGSGEDAAADADSVESHPQ